MRWLRLRYQNLETLKHSKYMMKYLLILILSYFTLLASDAFITPSELKASLDDKNLIVIDVSDIQLYDTSHIEGAIYADISKFIDKNSLKTYPQLASEETIQKALRKLGINSDSKVVIYSHNSQQAIFNSSYLAFVLLYSGLDDVSILDGGYMAWVFENELLISSITPDIEKGNITVEPRKYLIATGEDVKNSTAKILDARSYDEYYGVSRSEGVERVGHIKGAKSSYYETKFLKDYTLRDRSELDELYIAGHELGSNDEIIVYARDVLSASMEFFILYKLMGFKNTKLYEASLLENNKELPMTRFKWE